MKMRFTARGWDCSKAIIPTSEARQQFFVRSLRSLRTNPAFADAAMTSRFRMTFGNFCQYEVDGQTYVTDRDRPRGNSEAVSDGFFTALGLKILEGRDFTIEDNDAKQPVAIVNSTFARKYFGNASAIGRRIRQFNPAQLEEWRTIVGVVPDTLMQGPFNQQTDAAGFYIPLLGTPPAPQFVTVVVKPRPGQRAETLAPTLSQAVSQIDANLPVYFGGTPARLHDEILGVNRITATLFTIFGIAAVLLSSVGLVWRDEFLGESTHAGVRHSHGAGRGCAGDFAHGDVARRVAARRSVCSSESAERRCCSARSGRRRCRISSSG